MRNCFKLFEKIKLYLGDTPLLDSSRDGYFDIVKYLVDFGADVNVQDARGMFIVFQSSFFLFYELNTLLFLILIFM